MLRYLLAGALLPLLVGAGVRKATRSSHSLRESLPELLWLLTLALAYAVLGGGTAVWPTDVKQFLPHLALLSAALVVLPAKWRKMGRLLLTAALIPLLARPYIMYTWQSPWNWLAPVLLILLLAGVHYLFERQKELQDAPTWLDYLPLAASASLAAPLIAVSGSLRLAQYEGVLAALFGGAVLASFFRGADGRAGLLQMTAQLFHLIVLLLAWLYGDLPALAAGLLLVAPLVWLQNRRQRLVAATVLIALAIAQVVAGISVRGLTLLILWKSPHSNGAVAA